MTAPVVEFQNVTLRYGATTVLENINLHLHKGQFAGILGPSGAGKTTLLKTVLGLIKPSEGKICLGGKALNSVSARRIAYVPQVEAVNWNFPLTVEQAVLMGRTQNRSFGPWSTRAERKLAARTMERLGLTAFAERHIRELSGGQQQRIFLARALIAEPDLLVLDEPTAGVDMRTQEEILHLLADLNHDGMTILMTTHDLNAAASHLPWVVCLNRTIVAQGEPDDVFVPEILNATYNGDMIVVRQGSLIFVQERPHHHCVHELHPHPVLSHPAHEIAPEISAGPAEAIEPTVEPIEHRGTTHGHPVNAV